VATPASKKLDASIAYRWSSTKSLRGSSDEGRGLSEAEARTRLAQYGPNELPPRNLFRHGGAFSRSFRMCSSSCS
jgi:hypothetical protein